MTERGTPCAHCLAPAAGGKTFRTLYGNCLHLCPACWEAADKRKASDFDTTNDTLFEGMQIAVEAALREDVDDPSLAVTRAVFAFLQAHFSQTHGIQKAEG